LQQKTLIPTKNKTICRYKHIGHNYTLILAFLAGHSERMKKHILKPLRWKG